MRDDTRPDPALAGQRERAQFRQLVRDRGPDAGASIDHLKLRSMHGLAEQLAERTGFDPLSWQGVEDLTRRDGDRVSLLFMADVSAADGGDIAE